MVDAWYCTREQVMAAPDIKASAYASSTIDASISSSSRLVDRLCHVQDNNFVPWTGSKSFPYPNAQNASIGTLWLDKHRLISLSAFTSGGVTVAPANVFLEPSASGPPYNRIEINRATSSALAMNSGTAQRSLVLTGVWGERIDESTNSLFTLNGAVNSSVTSLGVILTPIFVGDVLRIDSERMIVTEKAWVSSSLTGSLAASNAAQSLTVSDGTVFAPGEELIIDAERVLVLAVTGNILTVQRAVGGSTLAAHTTSLIYWPRSPTVVRGALGTTAASHLSNAQVYRHAAPAPINELALAYSLDSFFQKRSGYARTIGSGDAERMAVGGGIKRLEERVIGMYGRSARVRAV